MRAPKIVLLAALCGCAPWISNARADFENNGTGARPAGFSGAYVGLADDAQAVVYNPAGLAYLRRGTLTADYARLLAGLDDKSTVSSGFIAVGQPLRRRKSLDERIHELRRLAAEDSAVESSTATAKSKDPRERGEPDFFKDWGTLSVAFSNLALSGAVTENKIWLGYGRKIMSKLAGGFTFKFLNESYQMDDYTRNDPVFAGGKTSILAMSADAGLLYNVYPKMFIGLAATDVNQPNVALNSADKDAVPMRITGGLSYRDRRMNAAADVVYVKQDYRLLAGIERWFKNRTYGLRAGGGFGSRDYKNASFGASVNWGSIQLDYAFTYPISGVRETLGSHRMSFTYRFGRAPVGELATGSLELYYSKLQTEAEILRAQLEKSESERSRMEKVLVEEALSRIKEKVRAERLEAGVAQSYARGPGGAAAGPLTTRILSPLAGPAPSGVKTYVTLKGDTLQSIAEIFYGKKERWLDILNLNKDKVGRGGTLKVGTVLLIPGVAGAQTEESVTNQTGKTLAPIAPGSGQSLSPLKDGESQAPSKTLSPLKAIKSSTPSFPDLPRVKTYQVQQGDTLQSIADKMYGDPKKWKDIYNANKDKVERGSVNPGQVLNIP